MTGTLEQWNTSRGGAEGTTDFVRAKDDGGSVESVRIRIHTQYGSPRDLRLTTVIMAPGIKRVSSRRVGTPSPPSPLSVVVPIGPATWRTADARISFRKHTLHGGEELSLPGLGRLVG